MRNDGAARTEEAGTRLAVESEVHRLTQFHNVSLFPSSFLSNSWWYRTIKFVALPHKHVSLFNFVERLTMIELSESTPCMCFNRLYCFMFL